MGLLLATMLAATAALYTLSAVAHLLCLFRRGFDGVARCATRIAWGAHTVSLVLLVLHTGRAPVHTHFEFSFLLTWLLTAGHNLIDLFRKNQTAGPIVIPLVAVLQVVGVALPTPGGTHLDAVDLPNALVGWHIWVTMLGYGFFVASFVAGALYLLQERNLRVKRWGPLYYRLPSLEVLDIWGGRFVYVGFSLMTIGLAAGIAFARATWQHLWRLDPKVLFTLLVWLLYAGYLLMRNLWGWGGRKAAWWSVIGTAGLLINYLVVNALSSLHRYGV